MNKKNKLTSREKIVNITMIALFAAISYLALAVLFVPFANMYIHLGNMIVVLAALLIGGWQGGLAGSIGMGFFDIFSGLAASSIKTFLLKFLIGLTVGAVYKFLCSRKKFPVTALALSGAGLFAAGLSILVYMISGGNGFSGRSAILFPVFSVLGIICITFAILKKRLSQKIASAVVGAVCGMAVNILGETIWKFAVYSLAGSAPKAALITALLGQASTLINAGIAIVGGVMIFSIAEKPLSNIIHK